MNHNNPTIARLLAKENVTVQHGNYKTAWFDVKNRVLGLPLWKDMGKDVYDLLVGHEVGHALYTPYEGWHDTPEKIKGVPRSYMNVIEDARIERFVQSTYPGLVGPFKRGYQVLLDMGLFSDPTDENIAWDQVKLIDKINLKSKLGNLVDVPFNKEEKSFYKKARFMTQTFAEVVQLCRDILAYTQENTPELIQKPQPEGDIEIPEGMEEIAGEGEAGPQMGHDDYLEEDESSSSTDGEQSSEEDETSNSSKSESEDGDETDDRTETNNSSSESDETDTSSTEEDSGAKDKGEGEEDISLTDEAHRQAERTLLEENDRGEQPCYMRGPSKEVMKYVMHSFKDVHQDRLDTMERANFYPTKNGIMKDYNSYLAQVKRASNFAVKEFEMRKAGYQWQRAETAKTGSLDLNKVHAYKFNEDIFARVTKLANAKNHGMIMMIDYSGSMGRTLSQVIDQLFHLVTFCKTVNIPFDVYAFTSGNRKDSKSLFIDGDLDMAGVSLPLLISSSLKKVEYNQALEGLYMKMKACDSRNNWRGRSYNSDTGYYEYDEDYWDDYHVTGKQETWGSTPLNACLVLGHTLIRQFKIKHMVDKMNLIILSDGDSNSIYAYADHKIKAKKTRSNHYSNIRLHVDGKLLKLDGTGRRATYALLENISKRYACTTVGFFVSDRPYDWRSKLYECDIYDAKDVSLEYRRNKCVSLKKKVGYDELYLVKGGEVLGATEDDFEIDDDASTAKIRTAFKKFSASKKKNKVLLTNFGKAVA